MKKGLRYSIGIIAVVVVAYNSVYFKKLDEVKVKGASSFNAKAYAEKYFTKKLAPVLDQSLEINKLVALVREDRENTFRNYAHALGIGNIRYFLVKGQGEILSVNENDVSVLAMGDSAKSKIRITTEFVYGNAIRDASGLININDFSSTMDFNNVSEEINRIIRERVIPPFKTNAKKGGQIGFYGAVEMNMKHPDTNDIEIIPISLRLQ